MIYTIATVTPVCASLRDEGRRIVLATGFFDLFHAEHENFLKKAKGEGDVLVVAVESDERARMLKGEDRPVETQSLRCQHILDFAAKQESWSAAKLECCKTGVLVVALPPDFDHFEAYDSLMAAVQPSVYAVSSHTEHIKSKTFLVEKYGGRLAVVHDWNPEISTTKLINKINKIDK